MSRSVLNQVVIAATLAGLISCSREGPSTVGPELGPDVHVLATAAAGTGRYILLFKSSALPPGLEKKVASMGGEIEVEIPEIGAAVVSSETRGFRSEAEKLEGLHTVMEDIVIPWVGPAEVVEGAAIADVFGNPPTSGDDDFFFDLQWGHDAVDSPEAWNEGHRGAGVRLAILDSGIDADHPDLAPNLNVALSTSFVPGEGFDVGPGFFFNHGSHVAGIAAAADNASGIIGVAPEAEIVAVKVLSQVTGRGSFSGVAAGIVYAAMIDADVINMSIGAMLARRGEVYDENTGELIAQVPARDIAGLVTFLTRATQFAHHHGTTIIASAGNAGVDGDKDKDRIHLLSDLPHVISVAATGPLGWAVDSSTDLDPPAFFTNFGRSVIDFGAPGGNVDFGLLASGATCTIVLTRPCWVFDLVFSTIAGGWGWAAGTSMAAPHVTGVAAIVIGQNGGSMHPAQVEAELRRLADRIGGGNTPFYGGGRADATNSVD